MEKESLIALLASVSLWLGGTLGFLYLILKELRAIYVGVGTSKQLILLVINGIDTLIKSRTTTDKLLRDMLKSHDETNKILKDTLKEMTASSTRSRTCC